MPSNGPSPDWTRVNVRWRSVYLDGKPATGTLTFKLNADRFVDDDPTAPRTIIDNGISVPIRSDGTATVDLPATDDPDITPSGPTVSYLVTEKLDGGGGSTYSIQVPVAAAATGIDLASVIPVSPVPAEIVPLYGGILHGHGAPSAGTGQLGSYYIDDDALRLYGSKTGAGWGTGVSLVGPSGGPVPDMTGVPDGYAVVADSGGAAVQDLATRFARRGWLPAVGPNPAMWDDFHRTDRQIKADISPSGHTYLISGTAAETRILDNQLHFDVAAVGSVRIAYVLVDNLDSVAGEYVWYPGASGGENMVIGACKQGFGTGGSIQLATYAVQKTGGPVIHWQLFCVQSPIVDPYPIIASGTFAVPYERDGTARYAMGVRRSAPDTVVLELPDDQIVVAQDAFIATYWGNKAGWQLRRATDATDGYGEFTRIAANGSSSLPVSLPPLPLGAQLKFSGLSSDRFSTPAPEGWTPGDLEVVAYAAADDWTSGAIQVLASQWDATLGVNFYFGISATGNPTWGMTVTGSPPTISAGGSPGLFTDGRFTWLKMTYRASDGQTKFFKSSDPVTTDPTLIAWTQIDTNQTTGTGGAPFPSTAPIEIGSRDGALRFAGRLMYLAIKNGIGGTVVAGVDFIRQWRGLGIANNPWAFTGTGIGWLIGEDSVPNLKTDLAFATTGTPPQVDTFTTVGNSTWTKPAGAVRCEIIAIAGGGAGGAGRRGLAGAVRAGGAGGSGGYRAYLAMLASTLGATEPVAVGGGGSGAPAVTVDTTSGATGGDGTLSAFGPSGARWVVAYPGQAGAGGAAAAAAAGAASAPGGAIGGASSATGLIGIAGSTSTTKASPLSGGGGGGGGGISTANVDAVGGGGSLPAAGLTSGAPAGGPASTGTAGANGAASPSSSNRLPGGSGAGGGGSSVSAAGNGGNGGYPGGGGGGGGASLNGFNSGAGGNGADGLVIVITHFQ